MESLIALPDHFDSVDIALFDQLGSSISAKETDMLACGICISYLTCNVHNRNTCSDCCLMQSLILLSIALCDQIYQVPNSA
jgi:hypothetical protein